MVGSILPQVAPQSQLLQSPTGCLEHCNRFGLLVSDMEATFLSDAVTHLHFAFNCTLLLVESVDHEKGTV